MTGATLKEAIRIFNAVDTDEGVAAEHRYVSLVCESKGQAYTLLEQQLIHRKEKSYDRLKVQLDSGKERDFYFDISSFYGKFSPQLELIIKKKPE
jgi:hypothetical protein